MGSEDTKKRIHICFSGRVQGVGFRHTVSHIAKPLHISGFVRNLWNGDVEIIAEGTEQVLVDFLRDIRNSQLKRYIAEERLIWRPATGEFEQFGVSY